MPIQFTKQSFGRPNIRLPYIIEHLKSIPESVEKWSDSPCLLWPFSRNSYGYGTVWDGTKVVTVHRLVFENFFKSQLGSKRISPLCGHSHCFNPHHFRHFFSHMDFLIASIRGLADDPAAPWSNYECMEWPFQLFPNRYGLCLKTRNEAVLVHRQAFEIANGPFPQELKILHRCDNPPCYRPIHLFSGTMQDNFDDMVAKGRQGFDRPRPNQRGDKHHNAKYTWEEVDKMREMYASGIRASDIADSLGRQRSTVHRIVTNRSWVRR